MVCLKTGLIAEGLVFHAVGSPLLPQSQLTKFAQEDLELFSPGLLGPFVLTVPCAGSLRKPWRS